MPAEGRGPKLPKLLLRLVLASFRAQIRCAICKTGAKMLMISSTTCLSRTLHNLSLAAQLKHWWMLGWTQEKKCAAKKSPTPKSGGCTHAGLVHKTTCREVPKPGASATRTLPVPWPCPSFAPENGSPTRSSIICLSSPIILPPLLKLD